MFKVGLGQDSHRFEPDETSKPLILGGVFISGCPGLEGNSDADVVLHALTNAISGISGVNILGKVSDELCLNKGITNSVAYLEKALETLGAFRICHVSASIECKRPKLASHITTMREEIARRLQLSINDVGITATSGEGLTAFGRGEGIQVLAIVTACTGV
jgi:2-C-methyl-D-erythritol 2,4-cyclodiphosphate synthase